MSMFASLKILGEVHLLFTTTKTLSNYNLRYRNRTIVSITPKLQTFGINRDIYFPSIYQVIVDSASYCRVSSWGRVFCQSLLCIKSDRAQKMNFNIFRCLKKIDEIVNICSLQKVGHTDFGCSYKLLYIFF